MRCNENKKMQVENALLSLSAFHFIFFSLFFAAAACSTVKLFSAVNATLVQNVKHATEAIWKKFLKAKYLCQHRTLWVYGILLQYNALQLKNSCLCIDWGDETTIWENIQRDLWQMKKMWNQMTKQTHYSHSKLKIASIVIYVLEKCRLFCFQRETW